jgi:hypothetical protein
VPLHRRIHRQFCCPMYRPTVRFSRIHEVKEEALGCWRCPVLPDTVVEIIHSQTIVHQNSDVTTFQSHSNLQEILHRLGYCVFFLITRADLFFSNSQCMLKVSLSGSGSCP